MRIKRILKISGAILFALVAALGLTIAITFSGTAAILDGKELAGGVRLVKDGFVSAAVLPAGEHEVVLVDCGNDAAARPLLAELKRRGLGPEAVSAILITHAHPDHIAGCKTFPKAELYGMAAEQPLLEGRAAGRGLLGKLLGAKDSGLRFSHALEDGAVVHVGTLEITAFAVPGHTAGSAAYLVSGILFLGDSADATSDGKMAGSKWLFSDDRAQDHASLRKLSERLAPQSSDIKWLVFSHSAPLEGLGPLTAFASSR